jgi:hypothetical protein
VRRSVFDLALVALLATLVLAATLAFVHVRHGLALDVYVLVLGALALAAGASLTRAAAAPGAEDGPLFDRALVAEPTEPERPAQLARIEREVHLGCANALYFHSGLRTTLRQVVGQRLRTRRGADLDAGSAETRDLLGDAWDLLRPDRPPPADRYARGVPIAQVAALVDSLERI